MEIQRIEIAKLNPAPYNPRKNLQPGDPEYDALSKAVKEFGLVEPLIWNKRTGNLISGHQRLKILKKEGEREVEVSVVDLPLKKEKALNLALNKIAGKWDKGKLKTVLAELDTAGLDMEMTGFSEADVEELMAETEPWSIEEILQDFELGSGLERPAWVVMRLPEGKVDELEKILSQVKIPGLKVEKSYEMGE